MAVVDNQILIERIDREAIYRTPPDQLGIPSSVHGKFYTWQFYMRRVLMDPTFTDAISSILVESLDINDTQLVACESAGVVLGYELARKTKLNCFTIKKVRKEYGLLNHCEGKVLDKPAILVDDLAGSTNTLKLARKFLQTIQIPVIQYCVVIDKTVATHKENYLSDIPMISAFKAHEFALSWDDYCERYKEEPVFENWR